MRFTEDIIQDKINKDNKRLHQKWLEATEEQDNQLAKKLFGSTTNKIKKRTQNMNFIMEMQILIRKTRTTARLYL